MVFNSSQKLVFLIILTIFFFFPLVGQSINYKADNIKIQQKKKIIFLIGNAFIQKGSNQGLKADKIIWNQNTKIVEAFNNVTFLEKKQGIVYKGNYLKFFIDKDEVLAKKKPSVEKKKKNLIMFADTFRGSTKKNILTGEGNVKVNIVTKKKKKIIMTGRKGIYDLKKNIFKLTKDVKITQVKNNSSRNLKNKKPKVDVDDYDVYCEQATFYDENELLECFVNARAINRKNESILKGKFFFFNSQQDELRVKENVYYSKKNEDGSLNEALADELKIFNQTKKLIMTGNVYVLEKKKGKVTQSIKCERLNYFFKKKQENMECVDKVTLFDATKDGVAKAEYFFYDFVAEQGSLKRNPHLIQENENQNNILFADVIDIDDKQKKVFYRENVKVYQQDKKDEKIENEIICNTAFLNYSRAGKEIFECQENVVIENKEKKIKFFGDNFTTFFENDYSILKNNVYFIQQRNFTNYLKGTSEYIENFQNSKYALLKNNVEIIEYNQQKEKISSLNAMEGKYNYAKEYNFLEGFKDVKIKDIKENTTLYADYLNYNEDLNYGYVTGSPLLIDKNQDEDSFVYAEKIELYNKLKLSKMSNNIVMFSSKKFKKKLPLRKFNEKKMGIKEFITCQKGNYNYSKVDLEEFTCLDSFNYFDRNSQLVLSSDYMKYDINQEHVFLTNNPNFIKNEMTNKYSTYSDTMDFFLKQKKMLFNTNVLMVHENNFTKSTNITINCDSSIYNYQFEELLECFKNVKVLDYVNNTKSTSDYLRFMVNNEYSYMSENAQFWWEEKNEKTYVKGDIFERFEKEKLMYVKGNVFVDNGVNQGESSLGLYDIESDLFVLYSNPKIKDNKGSEFYSEEVTFDLNENKLILDNDINGVLNLD